MSEKFPSDTLETVLGSAAKILVLKNEHLAASVLVNAEAALVHWDHDNWNGGQDTWRLCLAISTESYLSLKSKEDVERTIDAALEIPMAAVSNSDFIRAEITTALECDPDWRLRVRQHLSGEGITNQGRAHSRNVATIEHDGLLFRSRAEVNFYSALKSAGVPFAPLSVVIGGATEGQRSRRVEPDFIIYQNGLVTVVEIDGDLWHSETPEHAHSRLKFLMDEGPRLERISASACDTPQKAKEAAGRIIHDIEKRRRSRV